MSLFSFSYDSPADGANQNYPSLTPVSTQAQADAFKARYAAGPRGGTNWDRGLAVAAEAANRFDVVVVITDGNPTNYSSPRQGSGSFNRIREVENGIFSANAIKAEGTRVLGFGVGDAITADPNAGLNLRAISGPIEYNGSNTNAADYYLTADYAAAGAALKALAQGNCQGSITVVKQVVPSTAPAGSITGATPDGGWVMTAAGSPGVTVDPPTSGTTADGTGAVNFPLTFAGGTTTGPVTVTETQQPGFTLQQVAGANAVCVRSDTGASIPVTNSGALGFQAAAATATHCPARSTTAHPPRRRVSSSRRPGSSTARPTPKATSRPASTQSASSMAPPRAGGCPEPGSARATRSSSTRPRRSSGARSARSRPGD